MRAAVVVFVTCAACTSTEAGPADATDDATTDALDAAIADSLRVIDDSGADVDDVEDFDIPDYGTRPDAAGWCLSRGGRHGCERGGACTFTGHCVSPEAGAGLDEAGVVPCGAIECDPAWCACIDRAASTCDCTP